MKALVYTLSVILLMALAGIRQAAAQAQDCSALFTAAVQAAAQNCAGLGRNQVCLASGAAVLQAQPGFESAAFAQPGDIIDAAAINTLTTTSTDDSYALTVMRLQLNQSEEAVDMNTIMILMGAVDFQADLETQPTWAISPLETQLETEMGTDIYPSVVPPLGVFNFTSTDSVCAGDLPNGLLVQSPNLNRADQNYDATYFTANGLDFMIGSTVVLTGADSATTVEVLEHYASVSNEDGSVTVFAGQQAEIPTDGPWVSNEDGTIVVAGNNTTQDSDSVFDELFEEEVVVNRPPAPAPRDNQSWNELTGNTVDDFQLATEGIWSYTVYDTGFWGTCPIRQGLFPPMQEFVNLEDHLTLSPSGDITGFNFSASDMMTIPMDRISNNFYQGFESMGFVKTLITLEKSGPFQIDGYLTGVINDGVMSCIIQTPIVFRSCWMDVIYHTTDVWCPVEFQEAMGIR